jgi:hypothetical protein
MNPDYLAGYSLHHEKNSCIHFCKIAMAGRIETLFCCAGALVLECHQTDFGEEKES